MFLLENFYQMNRVKLLNYGDDVVQVKPRLYGPNGHYTVPDIYFPQSGNVLDGSIGLKSPYSRQVRGWHSSSGGQVEIARPDQLGGPYSIPRRRQ
jgi:hypothetical protein